MLTMYIYSAIMLLKTLRCKNPKYIFRVGGGFNVSDVVVDVNLSVL